MKKSLLLITTWALLFSGCNNDEVLLPISCFDVMGVTIEVGTPFEVTNCSQNASSYKWLIYEDGVPIILSLQETPTLIIPVHGDIDLHLVAYNGNDSSEFSSSVNVGSEIGTYLTGINCRNSVAPITKKEDGLIISLSEDTSSGTVIEMDESYQIISTLDYPSSVDYLFNFDLSRKLTISTQSSGGSQPSPLVVVRDLVEDNTQSLFSRAGIFQSATMELNKAYTALGKAFYSNEMTLLEMDLFGSLSIDTTYLLSYNMRADYIKKTDEGFFILITKEGVPKGDVATYTLALIRLDNSLKIIEEKEFDYSFEGSFHSVWKEDYVKKADFDLSGNLIVLFERKLVIADHQFDITSVKDFGDDDGFDFLLSNENIYVVGFLGELIKFDSNHNILWKLATNIRTPMLAINGDANEVMVIGEREMDTGSACGTGSRAYYARVSQDGIVMQ